MGEIMDTSATASRGFPILFLIVSDFSHQWAMQLIQQFAQLAVKPPTKGK